jgi:hypothetical protein
MIKKLSASLFALALVVGALAPAQAQDTVAIYGAPAAGGYSRVLDTPAGGTFDIAVLTQTDNSSAAAEFVITDVKVLFPSVFRLSVTKINNTQLDLGDNTLGEYLIAYGTCIAPGGPTEVVRITYGDFASEVGQNVVLALRGFQAGDTRPSSFNGEPGYVDCTDLKHPFTLEAWDFGTGYDPTKLPTVDSADGAAVLNPQPDIPTAAESISTLKGRF